MDSFKIPVLAGINDIPLPPNYNGNGKSCNGAYYIDKFNSLIDYISLLDIDTKLLQAELFTNVPDVFLSLGETFLGANDSLEFTYTLNNEDNNPTGYIFGGTNKDTLQAISPLLAPNDVYEFYPNEFAPFPNSSEVPLKYYFQIKGQNEVGLSFETDYFTLSWGGNAYIGFSENPNLESPFSLNELESSPVLWKGINKQDNLGQPQYFYLFIPIDSDFPDILSLIDVATHMPIPLKVLGEANGLKIYRTTVKTHGNWDAYINLAPEPCNEN